MKSFDDFLEQEAYGGALQDTGHFTIGAKKALEKLAKMTLDEPSAWVLKMVQAAVVNGCKELTFRLARQVAQVDFSGPAVELEEIRDGLLDPSKDAEPFFKELFVGLRTLLFRGDFRIKSANGSWLAWDGEKLHDDMTNPPVPGAPGMSLVVSLDRKERAITAGTMHKLLSDLAVYAPLKLMLDGRQIRPEEKFAVKPPEFGVGHPIWTAPLLYAHFRKNQQEMRAKKAPQGFMSDPLRNEHFFLSIGAGEEFEPKSCHLNIQIRFQDKAEGEKVKKRELKPGLFEVELTRFGVICHRETFDGEIHGCLHLANDDGRSDISGLQLQGDASRKTLMVEVNKLMNLLMSEVRKHRSITHYYPTDSGRWKAGFVMAGGAAALLALSVGAAPLLTFKLGSAAGVAGSASLTTIGYDTAADRMKIVDAINKLMRRLNR